MFVLLTSLLFALAVAMSVYVWHLRRMVVQVPGATVSQPVAPPGNGPAKQVTLWVAYDDPGVLHPQAASIPVATERQQGAEQLLRALLDIYTTENSSHPLRAGAEVHNVYFVDPGLVVIDVNAAFADGQASGVLTEDLTIASLSETLSANYPEVRQVKFLVDGKERDTLAGHADLSAIYDIEQISELVKQLSAP
jgi:hypothetical protein